MAEGMATNRAKLPYRLSAIVFLLFTLGHTRGFLLFQPTSEAGRGVLEQMKRVSCDVGGSNATWWGLDKGFGLSVSAGLLFATLLTWRLSKGTSDPSLSRTITWLLCATQVANVAICLAYFGPVQAAFTIVSAACLAWAAKLA